jgi:hypothetical protein
MKIDFDLCEADCNSEYAPLAALCALYQQKNLFQPLDQITETTRNGVYPLKDKLIQVLLSMLAGCETLSEVNLKLRPERLLAQQWGWEQIADQSTLSRTLDQLSLEQIEQLRRGTTQIWRSFSQISQHNWHGFLWLEYDLSGLPCSAHAQESQKGYFGGKKTLLDAN